MVLLLGLGMFAPYSVRGAAPMFVRPFRGGTGLERGFQRRVGNQASVGHFHDIHQVQEKSLQGVLESAPFFRRVITASKLPVVFHGLVAPQVDGPAVTE